MRAKMTSFAASTGRCTSALAWKWRPATPLATVHSETPGERDYALDYAASHGDRIEVDV